MSTSPPTKEMIERLTDEELRKAFATAEQVLDSLRECFIVASLGISVAMQANAIEEFIELVRKLGVKDGFGERAIDILRAANIEPPDLAPLDKRRDAH